MAEESQTSTPPPPPADKQDPPPPAESNPTFQKEERPPPANKVDSLQPPVDLESTTTTTVEKEELPPSPPPTAPVAEENRSLAAMMEKESTSSPAAAENINEDVVAEAGKEKPPGNDNEENRRIPETLVSFKEESNLVADLSDFERRALQEFKQLVQDAINNRQLISSSPPPPPPNKEEDKDKQTSESDKSTEITKPQEQAATQQSQGTAAGEEVVSIWGIPLLKDDRSDVILLKFLRARDFKVSDAFLMIKNTLRWRKDFGIDSLLDEDLGDDLDKVVFMHGYDREGHPVCYNVYGEFQNKVLYHNTFSDDDKRLKFLRWRIQFLEKGIRKLDFRPGGVSTIFQVNDLKNSPGPGKRELRIATRQALLLLQDNYPEFVAKQVFINVPWWYLAFYTMISPFMTQRTKSKFVFAGPSKSAEILFKYISPEHVPIQYGGLSVDHCDCNPEFTIDDPATEITVKPGTKQNVEIIIYEKCTIVWEIRVVGWEVSYGAEFVPDAKDRYTIIIHKPTKLSTTDEPVVSHKFKVDELGKVLLTVDNPTSKKKKLLYRFKVEPFSN